MLNGNRDGNMPSTAESLRSNSTVRKVQKSRGFLFVEFVLLEKFECRLLERIRTLLVVGQSGDPIRCWRFSSHKKVRERLHALSIGVQSRLIQGSLLHAPSREPHRRPISIRRLRRIPPVQRRLRRCHTRGSWACLRSTVTNRDRRHVGIPRSFDSCGGGRARDNSHLSITMDRW